MKFKDETKIDTVKIGPHSSSKIFFKAPPALDYIMSVDEFNKGMVNRSKSEKILPGGKGINVSLVLTNLGVENTALGFIAGFTGKNIEEVEQETYTSGVTTTILKTGSCLLVG